MMPILTLSPRQVLSLPSSRIFGPISMVTTNPWPSMSAMPIRTMRPGANAIAGEVESYPRPIPAASGFGRWPCRALCLSTLHLEGFSILRRVVVQSGHQIVGDIGMNPLSVRIVAGRGRHGMILSGFVMEQREHNRRHNQIDAQPNDELFASGLLRFSHRRFDGIGRKCFAKIFF